MSYNKSVNWILLLNALVFLTPDYSLAKVTPTPAVKVEKDIECPEIKDKEEAMEAFLEAESLGVRLSSDTRSIFANCFRSDDIAAWDMIKVVESFEFTECKKNKTNPNCINVRYGVLADVYSSEPLKKRKKVEYENVELLIVNENNVWHVTGLEETPPLVSKEGLLRFLGTQKETHSNKKWIAELTQSTEAL